MALMRKLILVLLVAALASTVSACGRKGKLERLPDDEERKIYPTH